MTTAKDKLTPKPNNERGEASLPLQIRPVIKMAAPTINVPDIKVPAPQVHVDTAAFTKALDQMAAQFNAALQGIAQAMAEHDRRLIEVSAEHGRLLKALSERSQKAPVVNMPKRPDEFEVVIDNGDDEPTVMHIRGSNSP